MVSLLFGQMRVEASPTLTQEGMVSDEPPPFARMFYADLEFLAQLSAVAPFVGIWGGSLYSLSRDDKVREAYWAIDPACLRSAFCSQAWAHPGPLRL